MSTSEILWLAIAIIAGIIFVYLIVYFLKNRTYEGEIIEKNEEENRGTDDYTTFSYYFVLKTPEGSKKKIHVDQKIYKKFNKGDYIKKEKGKFYPEKIK